MYKLTTTDNTDLGYTDEIFYIRVLEDGTFSPTYNKYSADGVAYNQIVYNLINKSKIANAQTIIIEEYQVDELIKTIKQNSANIDYVSMMAGIF